MVARRAILSTLGWARDNAVLALLMFIAAVIAGPILRFALPFVASGGQESRQTIIDAVSANYWGAAVASVTAIVIGGIAALFINAWRAANHMYLESYQTIQQINDQLVSERAYVDQLLISPQHIANLKQVLVQIGSGPPGGSASRNSLYNQLREHLENSTIWDEAKQVRELIHEESDGIADAQQRLRDEIQQFGLSGLTGPQALLSRRLHDIVNGAISEFPDDPWFVEDGHLLKLGRDLGMAEVRTFGEALMAANNIDHIWRAIPEWPEVNRVKRAQAQKPQASEILNSHIAELMQRTSLPGRCRICRRET